MNKRSKLKVLFCLLLFTGSSRARASESPSKAPPEGHTRLKAYQRQSCFPNNKKAVSSWLFVESFNKDSKAPYSVGVRTKNNVLISKFSTNLDGDGAYTISDYKIDCDHDFLILQEHGNEWRSQTRIDLLNGNEIPFGEHIQFSPDYKYYLQAVTEEDTNWISADKGLSISDCQKRDEKNTCKRVWFDNSLNGEISKVVWQNDKLTFLASKESIEDESKKNFELRYECELKSPVECRALSSTKALSANIKIKIVGPDLVFKLETSHRIGSTLKFEGFNNDQKPFMVKFTSHDPVNPNEVILKYNLTVGSKVYSGDLHVWINGYRSSTTQYDEMPYAITASIEQLKN